MISGSDAPAADLVANGIVWSEVTTLKAIATPQCLSPVCLPDALKRLVDAQFAPEAVGALQQTLFDPLTRFPRPELLVFLANIGWMTDVTSHQEHVDNESRGSFYGPCISRLTP